MAVIPPATSSLEMRASAIMPFSECFCTWQCTVSSPSNGATKRTVYAVAAHSGSVSR